MVLLLHCLFNDIGPNYIQELLEQYTPQRSLCSPTKMLLTEANYNLQTYGYRAFSVCAPWLWYVLPVKLKSSPSVESFKKRLKTFLFKKAFY